MLFVEKKGLLRVKEGCEAYTSITFCSFRTYMLFTLLKFKDMRLVITGILAFIIFIMISAFKSKIEASHTAGSKYTEVSREGSVIVPLCQHFFFSHELKQLCNPADGSIRVPFRK